MTYIAILVGASLIAWGMADRKQYNELYDEPQTIESEMNSETIDMTKRNLKKLNRLNGGQSSSSRVDRKPAGTSNTP